MTGRDRPKWIWVLVAIAIAIVVALWRPWTSPAARAPTGAASAERADGERENPSAPSSNAPSARPNANATATTTSATTDASRAFASMKWGSGPRELGHKRPQEGNPEGPMSFALDAKGDAFVVDQVNGRVARFGADGSSKGTLKIGDGAQDVAIAKDGTVLVLDRLVDKSVTLFGPDGRTLGTLPIAGDGIRETGQVTGVFVDGNGVYVEREHGQLVRIGDTRGGAGARDEIPGRPSRDGSSFIGAFLEQGQVFLSATTRAPLKHRYTRALPSAQPARGILLLDTDRFATVYVASIGTSAQGGDAEWITCAALDDGRVLGTTQVTPNTMPEETFREFAVMEDGGVLHAEMTESGITYVRYDCR